MVSPAFDAYQISIKVFQPIWWVHSCISTQLYLNRSFSGNDLSSCYVHVTHHVTHFQYKSAVTYGGFCADGPLTSGVSGGPVLCYAMFVYAASQNASLR